LPPRRQSDNNESISRFASRNKAGEFSVLINAISGTVNTTARFSRSVNKSGRYVGISYIDSIMRGVSSMNTDRHVFSLEVRDDFVHCQGI
jgi:hypothetical protein